MRIRRRIRILVVLLPAALLVTGTWWWSQQGSSRMNPLETWCADELRRIAADLLNPTLRFEGLQLELPATVTLEKASLMSDGVAIVAMTSMRLEFRERPKKGRPLVIKSASFVDPTVKLIGRADGTLQGFSEFMKSTKGERYDDGGSSQPADILAIRHIAIGNGTLVWQPSSGGPAMHLDDFAMDLDTNPDSTHPGWYDFKADIDRSPTVKLVWDGGININDGDLAFKDTRLTVNLLEAGYSTLTPSIQDFLEQYGIKGKLALHVTGHVPLSDVASTDLTFDATLDDASAAFGEYQFPVKSAKIDGTYQHSTLAWAPLSVQTFDGTVKSSGSVEFADRRSFTVAVEAEDVLIERMLRPVPGKAPKYKGQVDLTANAHGARPDSGTTIAGEGHLTIENGYLIALPFISALRSVVGVTDTRVAVPDRGEIEFTLSDDHMTISRSAFASNTIAARGKGDIYYDGRLDGKVNAGPLEKAESLIGGVGELLGHITDRLLPWHVSGTWSEPVVTPAPMGFSLGGSERKDD